MIRPMNAIELKEANMKAINQAYKRGGNDALDAAIDKIRENLDDTDKHWQGMMKSIDLIEKMRRK